MRWPVLLLIGCVLPQVGCSLARTTVHNLINEPREYLDEKRISRTTRIQARHAWQQYCHHAPTQTPEFADGFVAGYADYLESGGTAQPPAVPPLRYRRSRYLTPEGHALVRDYMSGFSLGLQAAAQSGQRLFLTVPVHVPADPSAALVGLPPPGGAAPPPPKLRKDEQLPSPKPAADSGGATSPVPGPTLSLQVHPDSTSATPVVDYVPTQVPPPAPKPLAVDEPTPRLRLPVAEPLPQPIPSVPPLSYDRPRELVPPYPLPDQK